MHIIIKTVKSAILSAALCVVLTGCAKEIAEHQLDEGFLPPVVNPITDVNRSLRELPPPSNKVVAAVYDYTDQTGQFKPSDTGQTLSRAVTQGAASVLIKALQDVGDGSWFTVVEREKVANLLKERQLITQMRMTYLGEQRINPQALPPLLFAAIIFEGGIIGFDSNTQTGGVGAGLLGIKADVKYRLDTITVYLRAVSTKTGQVLASVTTHKTIASVGIQGGAFRYISVDKILEAEAGITKNEPDQLAVQQAIEKAVHTIIVEGAEQGIWSFEDKDLQAELIRQNRQERDLPVSAALEQPNADRQIAAATTPRLATASIQPEPWRARQETVATGRTDTQADARAAGIKPEKVPGWSGTLMTMNQSDQPPATGETN